jgi:hypothetical protein
MLLREDLLTNAKQSVERGREIVDRQRVVVHNMERAGLTPSQIRTCFAHSSDCWLSSKTSMPGYRDYKDS